MFVLFLVLLLFPFLGKCEDTSETMTGEWGGGRATLRSYGIDIYPSLILDEIWNLEGGKRRHGGEFTYLFDFIVQAKSKLLLGYKGGTFHADFTAHHGQNPSRTEVGSYINVNVIEARPFNALYALWYKQEFGSSFWIQMGKSDAYDHFTTTDHSELFLNAGFTQLPSCPFFPTYPDPAMSVIASWVFVENVSLTGGLFDGSLADGFNTRTHGVFGRFFDDLGSHAFIIGELNVQWGSGRFGLGAWKNTAEFRKFNGGKKRGMTGPYTSLDQILYKNPQEQVALFLLAGSTAPDISPVHYSLGAGVEWKGFIPGRPHDILGMGMSRVNFSSQAGFSKSYEASYEMYYHFHIVPWTHLEPDLQYVVHPGGNGLPNAIVFTFNLRIVL